MKVYSAIMRVVHTETWSVEAKDEAEARKKISELTDDVEVDETGGDITDWQVVSLQEEEFA